MRSYLLKQKSVILVAIFILAIALVIFSVKREETPKTKAVVGLKAPGFLLSDPSGKTYTLSELKGSVIFVNFWATWCPPCVEEMPTLDKLYHTFANTDLKILAVSVDDTGMQSVIPFMQKNNLSVPVYYNPDRSIANLYGTFKFPETYIINRQGVVQYKVIGSRDWSDAETTKVLQELVAAR